MIVWINGAFGAGKTSVAYELSRRLPGSHVYDPEQVGYFIRKNAPKELSKGDFQDIPVWREMNYQMLRLLTDTHPGDLIVPMTLVHPDYFDEIVSRLRRDGAQLRHFILEAGKETLLRRLKRRSLRGVLGKENFAIDAIDRCLGAFDTVITGEKIDTEHSDVRAVAELIAQRCGLALVPDHRGRVRRALDGLGVWLGYIQ